MSGLRKKTLKPIYCCAQCDFYTKRAYDFETHSKEWNHKLNHEESRGKYCEQVRAKERNKPKRLSR